MKTGNVIRKSAMEWWNTLSHFIKEHYAQRYFGRNWSTLTGREIQMVYEGKKPKQEEQL